MTMKLLDKDQHIARLGGKQKIALDENGDVLFINHHFFELRPTIDKYVSCNWMEFFPDPVNNQIKEISKALKRKGVRSSKSAKLIRLSVGALYQCGEERGYDVKVHHRPKSEDPSYSGISGLPADNRDSELLEAMAHAAFRAAYEHNN